MEKLIFAITVLILFLWAIAVEAHSWYDPKCCSGEDCAPITIGHVERISGGWRIIIDESVHPMARKRQVYEIGDESSKLLPSRDKDWHVCLGPATQNVFCVYKPDPGF